MARTKWKVVGGWLARACMAFLPALLTGCARAPSPLTPHLRGSIGMPHRGVLTDGAELSCARDDLVCLRNNGRHFGLPRFVRTIEHAAENVAKKRPGSVLTVGDVSAPHGGRVSSHGSHRTGRDADLLLYMTTLDGEHVTTSAFVHVERDGLAWDPVRSQFLRFDVEREWQLVKTLLEDPDARIQWLFASHEVKAMLLEWATARGESAELLARANDVLWQPAPPAQNHDDHLHARTACSPEEATLGCEPTGPLRSWFRTVDVHDGRRAPLEAVDTIELVQLLARPMDREGAAAVTSHGP